MSQVGSNSAVMIARAMLDNPKLLVLDEPTAGVDEKSKLEFLHTIKDLIKRRDLGIYS